jgi:hypothetical protein
MGNQSLLTGVAEYTPPPPVKLAIACMITLTSSHEVEGDHLLLVFYIRTLPSFASFVHQVIHSIPLDLCDPNLITAFKQSEQHGSRFEETRRGSWPIMACCKYPWSQRLLNLF